ncbi:MAG: response regulator [Pseudomonadota bacterium]
MSDFSKVDVLILDDSPSRMEILGQILLGFGARRLHKTSRSEDAMTAARERQFDLFIVDNELAEDRGVEFIRWLRRDATTGNAHAAIIVPSGRASRSEVLRLRDAGAHCVIGRPLSPETVMSHIKRVVRGDREFVVSDDYVGPDRRFKNEGPPPGSSGRRADDKTDELGEQVGDNLAQTEIDALVKPQKVTL